MQLLQLSESTSGENYINKLDLTLVWSNSTWLFAQHDRKFYQHVKYTGCTQKNGAVSKVNKKFISHLTRAQRTPSAAATVQVSHALTFRRLMSYIYGAPILDVSRSHTTTQHSR